MPKDEQSEISFGEDVLTVSQVSDYIKNKLCEDPKLKQIYVRGEITNLSKPNPSGHIYFSIKDEKDENSVLECAFFRGKNKDLDFEIKEGLEVLIFGSITIYKSKYQLNVCSVFPIKEGPYGLRLKQLKEKLSKEGLFDEKHKKEIPYLYKTLGLIASKGSAAYEDVIKVLKDRVPVNIELSSTLIQGKEAPQEIIRAINRLNQIKDIGVILIVRGGGSPEDLMCFNDEELARAIFNSKIPIITGIGHETDYTIADIVADKRASTPTMAAKMAVPDKKELLDKIESKRERLKKAYENFIKSKKKEKELTEKEKQLKSYKIILGIIILLIILYIRLVAN